MAKPRRAQIVRTKEEFSLDALRRQLTALPSRSSVYAWSLSEIYDARDAQATGRFDVAARMADAMKTDDALFVAFNNRLAPLESLGVELVPASDKAKAVSVAQEADALVGKSGLALRAETRRDIHGCLVDHGIAFATITWITRDDGTRVDPIVSYWPIEFVRWDPYLRTHFAMIDRTQSDPVKSAGVSGWDVPIEHGNGQWIVFSRHEHEPWKKAGAILPASTVWARHAFAIRDWAKGSTAHGAAKVVGEMPAGVALQTAEGVLTAEAAAMLALLRSVAQDDQPFGIRPAGSKADFIANASSAWQVWSELVANGERAAARIYLGTDGTLGTQGGAPGVDVTALLGVATTIVSGDAGAIDRGIDEGVLVPWSAINFGDSTIAPKHRYLLPKTDEEAAREAKSKRMKQLFEIVEGARKQGFIVDQPFVDGIARMLGVDPPKLPEATTSTAPTVVLAPTDVAKVTLVNEARASAGLAPLTRADGTLDPDGQLTVSAFAAKVAAALVAPPPTSTPVAPIGGAQ